MSSRAPSPDADAAEAAALSGDARHAARAMALLWTYRTRAAILGLMRALGAKRGDDQAFSLEDLQRALGELKDAGMIAEAPDREGLIRLVDPLRRALYAELLTETMAVQLQRAVHELDKFRPEDALSAWPLQDPGATVGVFRLAMFSGMAAEKLRQMAANIGQVMDWPAVLDAAAFEAFDGDLFVRVDPEWRRELIMDATESLCARWNAARTDVIRWALARFEAGDDLLGVDVRLRLAEMAVLQGRLARARKLLSGVEGATAEALRACLLIAGGNFAEGRQTFETALKSRQSELSARKRVFPLGIAWFYPLALLGQHSSEAVEVAYKFCLGESGTRSPQGDDSWSPWTLALGARLGETALEQTTLQEGLLPPTLLLTGTSAPGWADLWRQLLVAWIGPDLLGISTGGEPSRPDPLLARFDQATEIVRRALRACGFKWLEGQLDGADAVVHGRQPPPGFFVESRADAWRETLASLHALGEDLAASEAQDETTRLLWAIRMAPDGALTDIEVYEQKRGARDWNRPRAASLAKLAADEALSPRDAQVARAIQADPGNPRRLLLDRAKAIVALIGHPGVVLADDPEQMIELIEGKPELEVTRESDRFVIRLTPPFRPAPPDDEEDEAPTGWQRDEREALQCITLMQDSPQRVRVIRLSPAQQRVARIVGEGLKVPADAQEDVQKTLRSLAGHFQVQGDQARAARQAEPESRIRAELSPVGDDFMLRLVVAPLGPDGPRLAPGQGRTRLMSAIAGDTVSTQRNLQAEREHLEAVLDSLDFLPEPDGSAAGYEWLIGDPEKLLMLVERLPKHPAVAALDWPKGKHLRVVPVDHPQLTLNVTSQRDWFEVDGQATLDEGVIVRLSQLLEAGKSGKRFIPIGEGVYAALTETLKQRLCDLASLAAPDQKGFRLPHLAGAWLDEALEGANVYADPEFRQAVERLRTVGEQDFRLPRGLQAELRPYQEDGYRWMMGLANAGLGACLADDMGLGKTVQALALLLARCQGGAALVVAPTSLVANWRLEAERFAPALEIRVFGESDRDDVLADLGPGVLVLVSYAMFQLSQERFAAIHWHTAIVDEAQAIKNANAKRSIAVFQLDADFRLALSGTPVENRVGELWSIMHFVNPGLLGSLSQFNENFAGPIEKNRDRRAQHLLRRLTAPFIMRRTKAQVLQELPPRIELLMGIAPAPEEAEHYEALRRRAAAEAQHVLEADSPQARMNVLAQLTRLRRAACDPRLVSPEFACEGAKVQAFANLAADLSANGHKALVFSQFVDFLRLLQAPLDEAGIPYQYLDGATSTAERERRVAAFQSGDGDLFLISLKAGGFGLNLTAADYVVISDPWWNPATEDQAMGRAHRMGQRRPVTVYRMVTRGTVEERILRMHREKRALADSIVSETEGSLPSVEDLANLIRETIG